MNDKSKENLAQGIVKGIIEELSAGKDNNFNKNIDSTGIVTRYDLAVQKEDEAEGVNITDVELAAVAQAVIDGDIVAVKEKVAKTLASKTPLQIVNNGLVPGMTQVGKLWDEGYYFLPQVMLAADTLEVGVEICEEKMGKKTEKKGRIVVHVSEGDIHTIGKNIVKALFKAHGYEVIDLGIDVSPARVVEAVKEYKPDLLVGGALMTTTMSAFPKTAKLLEEEGIEIPFACGGGAVNQEFCETFKYGIYGGKASNAPALAKAASEGKSWQEIRQMFHK